MPGIKTSRVFYRRGVSNDNKFFGFAVQGNYAIVQPPIPYYAPNIRNAIPKPTPEPPTSNTINSIFFNGSNFLEIMGDGYTLGTNAFTIQFWINSADYSLKSQAILGSRKEGGLSINIINGDTITVESLLISTTVFQIPTLLPNTWYFIVYVKDESGNAAIYVNGIRSITGAIIDNNSYENTIVIGADIIPPFGTQQNFLTGYLSNICVTMGALYDPLLPTTTPLYPTAPFTPTVDTFLLINKTFPPDVIYADSSPYDYTIYANGLIGPQISSLNPPFTS